MFWLSFPLMVQKLLIMGVSTSVEMPSDATLHSWGLPLKREMSGITSPRSKQGLVLRQKRGRTAPAAALPGAHR